MNIKEQYENSTQQDRLSPYKKLILTNPLVVKGKPLMDVFQIEVTEEFTRIDFVYYADNKYINGGWVQMSPNTFIRPSGTSIKMMLIKAENIPLAPQKHHFKSTKDVLHYSLYFPPLTTGTASIDIVEMETNDPSFFNFFDVKLNHRKIIVNRHIELS